MAEAPEFITTDPDLILAELVSDYQTRTGRVLYPAQIEMLIFRTVAYSQSLRNAQTQDAAENNLVDFARAPALDYLGKLVGVTRLAAAPAVTTLQFTLNAHGGVTIPAGTRVASTDNAIVFETVEVVNVLSGVLTASVDAESQTTGDLPSYGTGTITKILDPQPFLASCTNTIATDGAAPQESDDELRERIKLAVESFTTAGSSGAYEFHAKGANPGIIDVAVVNAGLGQINIYPLMADGGTTPTVVLDQVDAACSGETVRPISDTVTVISPTSVSYNLTIDLTLYTDADGAAVTSAVTSAVNAWAVEKRQSLGQDIKSTQIIHAVHDAVDPGNIFDVDLPAFTDVVISNTQFGELGTLTVNIAGTTSG